MTRWRTLGFSAGRWAAVAAATAVAVTVLCGCDLFPGPRAVQLPEVPAAWRHFAIILRLTAVDGRDGTEHRLPDALPGAAVVLPVGRYAASVVLAQPVIVGPAGTLGSGDQKQPRNLLKLQLRPAGAVVPLDSGGDGVLHLTWERGVLAALILDLWRGGANPWLLNLERLDREMRARGGADPWALDRSAILSALQAGEMSAAAIRPRPKHTVSLPLAAGRWVWWDPLATPLHSDGRTAFTIQLAAGYHLLIHDSGAALAVSVSDDGTLLTTPAADAFSR